jgi:hypothetical protein
MRALLFGSLLGLLVACGDGSTARDDAAPTPDAPSPDAGPDPRGPTTVNLAGGANALLWDTAAATLYLTDNNANTLLKWKDAATGVQQVGTFPAATAGISLGDLVKLADGTILTASFGFGTQGTLFSMAPNGTSTALTGMVATRRRIGLGQDAAGKLYSAYFVGGGMMNQTGGVATVTITGTAAAETEIAGGTTGAGFKKLVGLVATATAVFVSDQTDKKIYKIAIPGNTVTTVATVASADLLAIMPNGDLLTGGATEIQRVTQAGVATTIFSGFEQVRGLAYDPTLRRLFVIEHSATVGVPDKLHVRPLDN